MSHFFTPFFSYCAGVGLLLVCLGWACALILRAQAEMEASRNKAEAYNAAISDLKDMLLDDECGDGIGFDPMMPM